MNIMSRSRSPWSSRCFAVPKKQIRQFRFVNDYQRPNNYLDKRKIKIKYLSPKATIDFQFFWKFVPFAFSESMRSFERHAHRPDICRC